MTAKSPFAGFKKLIASDPEARSLASAVLRALFEPMPRRLAAEASRDLVAFLGHVALFQDLRTGELKRLARIVHERQYADGEYIVEQGKPGAALFIVRSGVVEIVSRSGSGKEVLLAMLEAPASFEELAAMGDVVRWTSARARGPVTLVALGRSDLDALGRNFPSLANKILRRLGQSVSARVQSFLESHHFSARDEELKP